MATQVGTAVVKLTFDGKDLSSKLDSESSKMSASGSKAGTAWAVAFGTVIAKGVSKVATTISENLSKAITRTDTINKFPKVMQNWGFSADEARGAINKLSKYLDGLPTTMDSSVSAIQRMVAVNGDLGRSTETYMALNNALLATEATSGGVQRSMEQLLQVYSSGKMSMQDYKIIMESTPGLMKQVAQSMGMSAQELAYAMGVDNPGSPTVSAQQFLEQVEKLNKEGTGEFASFAEQAKTNTTGIQTSLDNLSSRVQAGWHAILNAIGSENIAKALDNVGYAFKTVGNNIAAFIEYAKNNTWVIDTLKVSLAALGATVAAIQFTNLITSLHNTITSIGGVAKALSALFGGHPIIALVAAAVAALAVFFTQTETGRGIIQKFGEIIGSVFNAVKPVVESVGSVFQKLGEVLGNVFSKIGGALGVVFETIGNVIGNLVTAAGPALEKFGNIFASVFGVIGEVVQKLVEIFNMMFPTIKPLIESVGNLLMTVGKSVLQIFEALLPLFSAVGEIFMSVIPPIVEILQTLLTGVIEVMAPIIMNIIQVVGQLISTIASALMPIIQTIGNLLLQLLPPITQIISSIVQVIQAILPPLTQIISLVAQVIGTIASALMPIIQALMPVIEFILNIVVTGINIIIAVITSVINAISGVISFVTDIITNVINFITNIIRGVADFIGNIFNTIANVIRGIVSGISNFIGGIVNGIRGFFEGLGNGIRNIFEGIKTVIGNIFSTISGIIKAPINGIISGINGVIGMINSITIPDWVPVIGGAHANIGYIPTLAQGGVTTGPTTAIIGEAGQEVVLPLQHNQDNWAGVLASTLTKEMERQDESITGRPINVYMTNEINNEMDAEDIGRKLMQSIRRAA